MSDELEHEVVVERRGRLGLLTLNRPRAINALTHGMIGTLTATLQEWAQDDAIATVAVTGAGERGLCAGGDVIALHRDATSGDGMTAAAFWRDEYAMNALIARYPKPFVACQDGIVLGGGIGVSGHGSHRVVTERSKLGFPEVTIGYIPDVGATWLLSRAPGRLGIRVALSAENVGPADAIVLGFSDAYVPSERLPALLAGLESEEPATLLAILSVDPGESILAAQRDWTDHAFSADTVREILHRLREVGLPEAESVADKIEAKSPIALAVTLEALRRAAALPSLEAALDQEYRVSRWSSTTHDFAEGIRAHLIDKDRKPQWDPPVHSAVTAADVEVFFRVPGDGDLGLARAHTSEEMS